MDATSALRRVLTAACAVAALALAPATASAASPAQQFPVGGTTMKAAYDAAVKHWGATPCGGSVTMVWSPMDISYNALSNWMALDPDAPSTFSECRITFNPAVAFDAPKLCTIMIHEVGHLLGHDHDHEAGHLMSEYYTTPIAACAGPAWKATAAKASSKAKRKVKARAASRKGKGKGKGKAKAASTKRRAAARR